MQSQLDNVLAPPVQRQHIARVFARWPRLLPGCEATRPVSPKIPQSKRNYRCTCAPNGLTRRSSPSAGDEEAFQGPKHAFGRPTRLADGLELESAPVQREIFRFLANLRPRKVVDADFKVDTRQTSVGSPVAASFSRSIRLHMAVLYIDISDRLLATFGRLVASD